MTQIQNKTFIIYTPLGAPLMRCYFNIQTQQLNALKNHKLPQKSGSKVSTPMKNEPTEFKLEESKLSIGLCNLLEQDQVKLEQYEFALACRSFPLSPIKKLEKIPLLTPRNQITSSNKQIIDSNIIYKSKYSKFNGNLNSSPDEESYFESFDELMHTLDIRSPTQETVQVQDSALVNGKIDTTYSNNIQQFLNQQKQYQEKDNEIQDNYTSLFIQLQHKPYCQSLFLLQEYNCTQQHIDQFISTYKLFVLQNNQNLSLKEILKEIQQNLTSFVQKTTFISIFRKYL